MKISKVIIFLFTILSIISCNNSNDLTSDNKQVLRYDVYTNGEKSNVGGYIIFDDYNSPTNLTYKINDDYMFDCWMNIIGNDTIKSFNNYFSIEKETNGKIILCIIPKPNTIGVWKSEHYIIKFNDNMFKKSTGTGEINGQICYMENRYGSIYIKSNDIFICIRNYSWHLNSFDCVICEGSYSEISSGNFLSIEHFIATL